MITSAQLRELADYLDTRPQLADILSISTMYAFADNFNEFTELVRELGTCEKSSSGGYLNARRRLEHGIWIEVSISQSDSCERVEVGQRTYTKQVPPEGVALVDIEVTEPIYEWVCPDSWLTPKEDT